jgi:ubiquitin-like protein ATG12
MTSPRVSPSPASSNDPPAAPTVPDEDHGVDLPMSMTASVILTNLPKDASQALADVEALDDRKGTTIRLSSHLAPSVPLPMPQ